MDIKYAGTMCFISVTGNNPTKGHYLDTYRFHKIFSNVERENEDTIQLTELC